MNKLLRRVYNPSSVIVNGLVIFGFGAWHAYWGKANTKSIVVLLILFAILPWIHYLIDTAFCAARRCK